MDHFLRHNLPEVVADQMPVVEQTLRELALGFLDMLLDQALQQRLIVRHFAE